MLKYAFFKRLVLPKHRQKILKSFKKTRKAKTSKPEIRTRHSYKIKNPVSWYNIEGFEVVNEVIKA